jgi:hypothetical protein
VVSGDRDPVNPELQVRGDCVVAVQGDGTAHVSGDTVRMYFSDPAGLQTWRNVEVTFYAMRVAETEALSYQGFTAGARSGDGHSGADPECLGTAYYGRMTYDGRTDFQKEIRHPEYYATEERGADPDPWDEVPTGTWIGYKLVVRDASADAAVQLELWRDLEGGAAGGAWELLTSTVDGGGWSTDASPDCDDDRPDDLVLFGAYPVVMVRSDAIADSRYRALSVREIEPAP